MSRTPKSKKESLLRPKVGALSVLSFEETPLKRSYSPKFPSSTLVSWLGVIILTFKIASNSEYFLQITVGCYNS